MSQIIREYQQSHHLVPDGIIGVMTTEILRRDWGLSKTQLAHFLGQCHVESGAFRAREENLNYSAKRLRQIFPKYFTYAMSVMYAGDQEMIANIAYSNRMGNGDICTGDGYRFRGRGSLMTTGRDNYERFGRIMAIPQIIDYPEVIGDQFYWLSGLKYFEVHRIWKYCHTVGADSVYRVTRIVNGGTNGLRERERWTRHYLKVQQ
jgi:putative chitinase